MFEPQHTESSPSAWWIRTIGVINLICMAVYLWWRCLRSLIGVNHVIWAYIFLGAEFVMAIGLIVGHSSRSFPVHREKVGIGRERELIESATPRKPHVDTSRAIPWRRRRGVSRRFPCADTLQMTKCFVRVR